MTRAGVRAFLSLVAGLLAAALGAGPAVACSCAYLSMDEHVAAADVVARVLVDKVEQPLVPGGLVVYHVTASRVWKGDVPIRFSFTSEQYGASCGLEGVREAQDLLLFAQVGREGIPGQKPGALASNLCSGTDVATDELIAEVTDLLGEGTVPTDPGEPVPSTDRELGSWVLPTVIALLGVTGVVVVLARRRR